MEVVGMVTRTREGRFGSSDGFTLIEVLVASMLFLTIILGIIPLLMRSMANNAGGNDYTRLSNFSKSEMEELFQLDFNSQRLAIPAGQTEASTDEYWSEALEDWVPGTVPSGQNTQWTRTTLVRQYNITAADKTVASFDFEQANALDGGTVADSVHLKEIIVTVRAEGSGPLGPERDIVLRVLKAK
jgi:prepilin-type N-terminal cleavage/methylation domain-containing protein